MKKHLLLLVISMLCGLISLNAKIAAKYSIPLVRVEITEQDSVTSAPIDILQAEDDELTRSKYEDNDIQIIWKCDGQRFIFAMLNKTNERITIDWDKIVYVDINSMTGRVIHNGTKYSQRDEGQLKSILPKGTKISDFLTPSENCYLSNFGWKETFLFPCVYKNKKELLQKAGNFTGSQMRIEFPLAIGDKEVIYVFYFELKDLIQKQKKK